MSTTEKHQAYDHGVIRVYEAELNAIDELLEMAGFFHEDDEPTRHVVQRLVEAYLVLDTAAHA